MPLLLLVLIPPRRRNCPGVEHQRGLNEAMAGPPMLDRVSDMIVDFCTTNPDQLFAQVVNLNTSTGESNGLDITRITARQLLEHGRTAAASLANSAKVNVPVTVSILARSGYEYLVNFVGLTLLEWTVSCQTCKMHRQC